MFLYHFLFDMGIWEPNKKGVLNHFRLLQVRIRVHRSVCMRMRTEVSFLGRMMSCISNHPSQGSTLMLTLGVGYVAYSALSSFYTRPQQASEKEKQEKQ